MTQKTIEENLIAIAKFDAVIELLRNNKIIVTAIQDMSNSKFGVHRREERELSFTYERISE